MAEPKALLSYRERVVQERQRMASLMSTRPASEQAQWAKVKHTRRLSLTKDDNLLVWAQEPSRVCKGTIYLLNADFDLIKGLTVKLALTHMKTSTYLIGTEPVHLRDDLFVALDALEPFTGGGDKPLEVRLLVFSGAGHEGLWPEGLAVGTTEEFHQVGK